MPKAFDYTLDYKKINLRQHPEKYRVGRGEQGVLLAEPYKSEMLPFWKFRTPCDAKKSAQTLLKFFKLYKSNDDFVGMDLARKFLQMGFTRSRRYANHKSGKKYDGPVPEDMKGVSGAHGREELPLDIDPVKAESALIFKEAWEKVESDSKYKKLKLNWKKEFG